MKPLEFEKVSIAAIHQEQEEERKRVDERARATQRGPQPGAVLHDATTRWMAELPPGIRPITLARKFPRIANSIAELWRRVASCEQYLDTLVVDQRGDRSGFPPEVAQELTALRGHYAELHPHKGSAWELVARDD